MNISNTINSNIRYCDKYLNHTKIEPNAPLSGLGSILTTVPYYI